MSRPLLRAFGYALALSLLMGSLPVLAASTAPTLYSMTSGKAKVMAQGAQKSWPIKVSEDNAFDAVFKGGMWLPNPSGGRIYAKYQRHILHANGTWSWIGTVATVHGAQSVVLTFGKDGMFGVIPQASGYPLRIVTSAGQTRVVETSAAAMANSPEMLRLRSHPDYVVPPRVVKGNGAAHTAVTAAADVPVQAAASGPVTIDVMVAYTPGFVTELGNPSAALTRIQNLIDLTNQAYLSSGINQQIRLVKTVEVDYPDNTNNQTALDELTGIDENGNPVTIPTALQGIASLRVQYGADLVALVRSFDNTTQGNCGVGWLIGGNQEPIVPSQSNAYGYSVTSDGTSNDLYCLPTTFAHELGHNMGSAHDRANATESGAYSYSYGYQGNGTDGFSTIMAYGTKTTTPLELFSNPNISSCENSPCGVADNASDSADNAHSMNNTAALIAAFEPTTVGNPQIGVHVRNDIDGDGYSDLIWSSSGADQYGYWLMMGGARRGYASRSGAGAGYSLVSAGDMNDDGKADLVWTGNGRVFVWLNLGGATFRSYQVGTYTGGWQVFGTGDVNGDGNADLLLRNPNSHLYGYWLMNGATRLGYKSMHAAPGYFPVAVGDFNSDGAVDMVWTSSSRDTIVLLNDGTGKFNSHHLPAYAADWRIAGAGDIDGDGNDDLIWENRTSGLFGYWLMRGATRLSYASINSPGTGYSIVALGDFSGDGKTDVAWSGPNMTIYAWINNGSGRFTTTYLGTYATGWSLIPTLNQ